MPAKKLGSLGEFEHLVLLATLRHSDGVFGSDIGRELEDRAERRVSRGALYATLSRLEQKGFVSWSIEEGGPDRGGHPRRRFVVTRAGRQVLGQYRRAVQNLVVGYQGMALMRPPRLVARLLSCELGSDPAGRRVLGDLAEEHADRARVSRSATAWWYRREALGVLLRIRSIARRPRPMAVIVKPSGDPLMRLLAHELRDATRTLRKEPWCLLVTSLTLALGIAAATSIFSVVNDP